MVFIRLMTDAIFSPARYEAGLFLYPIRYSIKKNEEVK